MEVAEIGANELQRGVAEGGLLGGGEEPVDDRRDCGGVRNGGNTLDFGQFGGRRRRWEGAQVEVAEDDAGNVADVAAAVLDAVQNDVHDVVVLRGDVVAIPAADRFADALHQGEASCAVGGRAEVGEQGREEVGRPMAVDDNGIHRGLGGRRDGPLR